MLLFEPFKEIEVTIKSGDQTTHLVFKQTNNIEVNSTPIEEKLTYLDRIRFITPRIIGREIQLSFKVYQDEDGQLYTVEED